MCQKQGSSELCRDVVQNSASWHSSESFQFHLPMSEIKGTCTLYNVILSGMGSLLWLVIILVYVLAIDLCLFYSFAAVVFYSTYFPTVLKTFQLQLMPSQRKVFLWIDFLTREGVLFYVLTSNRFLHKILIVIQLN